MKTVISFLLILLILNGFSQNETFKEVGVLQYLGTYIDGNLNPIETLSAPRINRYNEKGQRVSSKLFKDSLKGEVYQEFQTFYDNLNRINRETYGNGLDKIWSETIFSYDKNSNLKSKKMYDFETKKLRSTEKFKYDGKNRLVKVVKKTKGENKIKSVTIKDITEINSKTILIVEKKTSNKIIIANKEHTFLNGIKVSTNDLIKNDIEIYEYYEDGKIKLEKSKDTVGDGFRYIYEFDENGNVILEIYLLNSTMANYTVSKYY